MSAGSVMFDSSWPMNCSPPGSSVHGISHILNGMGCHFLLQVIFLTQGSNPRLLHWQADSEPQWHLGSPKLQGISSHNRWTCFITGHSQSAGRIRCPWWRSGSPLLWFSSFLLHHPVVFLPVVHISWHPSRVESKMSKYTGVLSLLFHPFLSFSLW